MTERGNTASASTTNSASASSGRFPVKNLLTPISPGELLDQEFFQPLGISQYRLAKAIDVPASRIIEIVTGQRAISADTDLRLCRFLGLSPGYWLRAQAAHDTEVASTELAKKIARI